MAKGTFRARLDELAQRVGDGPLVGRYAVNQSYAAYQHVHRHLRHPRGGGPDYVSPPLRARYRRWFRGIADALLSGNAARAMADALEDLDRNVGVLAPVDLGNLRQSGSITVLSAGRPVYTRPARVARLPDNYRRPTRR
jgi:hypothetical protein